MEQIAEFDESSFFLNQIQTQTEKTVNTRENSYHNPLRIVKCLLPKSIVRRYKENPHPQTERDIMKSPSAVLHIRVSIACSPKDISDPEIPEFKQMREVMNFVYEHVTYQGGDIIKEYSCLQFMEFSCIAIWNTENEDLSTVAQRAGNCALSLLHQHTEKQKEANKPCVTIKVGLDVGEVWYLSLGGYLSKWYYFVAGLPVKNAMIGATLAKGNDLISSPNAWRQIQENARGVPIHSDAQKIKSNEAASYYVIKSFDRNISKTVPFTNSRSEGMLGNSGNIDEESMQNRFETSLLSHIPRTLQFRLYSLSPSEGSAMTTNAWVPELRQITFLYMVLEDIAYEWEAAQRLSDIIYTCQWEFNHYGSCLDSVFVDGDKTVITCVWGLPTATFEDNAVRAITAARALQSKIKDQFSVKTRVGIAQGKMIYALTGSRNRYEQTLTGNASAISRSLAYSSSLTTKDEIDDTFTRILVDQSVFSESSCKVTFDESLPIEITVTDKWKHKLSAHRPLAVTQRDHNSSPNLASLSEEVSYYVIPQKEMDQIVGKITELATRNRGGLLYIEGPPGSGKSRLAFEIYKMSVAANLVGIMSSGHKYQQHTLFFPWRSIYAELLKLNGFSANSSALRQNCVATVLNEVSPFALTYAPLLNPILGVNFPSNEYFHFFLQSTSQNRESRFDKLRDLLIALMEWVLRQQPVVLILDDAHWIDPSSWNLALTLLKKFTDAYGILVVILTRPMNASLDQNVMKLLKLEDTVKLSLPPLTEKQSQELLAKLLGVEAKTLPAPILKLLLQTQGVPLFINEIAHLIRTNENISIYNKTLSIKSEVDFKVTESIGGLIMSRLDKLTPTLHLIVRVASVIGNEFEVPILLEAYPVVKGGYLSQPEWKESIAALEKLEIFKKASDKQNTFMFTHPLICDAAYNLLLIEQRRELHRACAMYYETHYATDLSGYYPLLAHHWKMAETDIQKIVYYLEKAGYQAWSNSSSSEVIQFFGELSEIVTERNLDYDPVHVSEWEWALAISHFQYYRNRKSREYLISIINKLDPPGLPKYGLPLLVAKQIAGFLWDFKWSNPAPPPIKDSYEIRRVSLASQAWRYVGILSIFLQEPSLAVYATNRSVVLAQRIENTDHYPKSLSLMAMIWSKINKAYSEDAFKRSLEIAEKRQDDPHCRMVVSLWSGYNNFNNGQLELAYTQVYEARKLASESGDNRTAEDSLFTLSMIQLLRGHVSESMRFVREDDTLTNLRGSYSMRSNCLAVKARILSLSNRLELAVQAIADAKHFVTEGFLLDDVVKLIIYGVYAQVFAMKADLEGTLEGARNVYEILVKNKEILNVIPLFGVVYAYYVVVKLFEQQTRFLESELNATLLNIPRARAASLGTRQQTQELINTLKTYIKVMRGVILEGCKVYPVVKPTAYHTEGLYQWYLCDHAKALELWNQGLQSATEFGMPLEKERLEKELKHRKRCKICKFVA